jgi:hypothetical protein
VLAQNNNTPITYWLEMQVSQIPAWIKANNELIKEQ